MTTISFANPVSNTQMTSLPRSNHGLNLQYSKQDIGMTEKQICFLELQTITQFRSLK